LITLSDGVFAFAITLAAVEIGAPDAWDDLADLWTQWRLPLLTYCVSFLFVASYWNGQRTLFARLVRVDARLTMLALLQLLFVALVPVATGLFYEHSKQTGAFVVYCATLAICGYLTAALWGYVTLHPTLVHVESNARDCRIKFSKALFPPLVLTWVALTRDRPEISAGGIVALWLARRFIIERLMPKANREAQKSDADQI
jgi:uncharacterized membrane protein